MNPFKQDRKLAQAHKEMMTIVGKAKVQKQQFDPKVFAHMAKLYGNPSNSTVSKNNMQILPREAQEQLLMKNDRSATLYNRKSGQYQGKDPMIERAVEDLIKKKIVFQANNA